MSLYLSLSLSCPPPLFLRIVSPPLFHQCGAAILLRGTKEEQLRFIFNIYDSDRCGRVAADTLARAIAEVHYQRRPQLTPQQCAAAVNVVFEAGQCVCLCVCDCLSFAVRVVRVLVIVLRLFVSLFCFCCVLLWCWCRRSRQSSTGQSHRGRMDQMGHNTRCRHVIGPSVPCMPSPFRLS